jgi:AraC family transcriptional regulator
MASPVPSTHGKDTHQFVAGGFHYRVTEYGGETSLPAHHHALAKMTTALRGAYAETFPRAGRFDCNARTLLMKPPDVTHTDRYLGPGPALLTIDLAPAALQMVQSELPLFHEVRQTQGTFPLIGRMVRELTAPDTASGLALEALALELIASVVRRTAPPLDANAVFRRACEYMDGSLAQPTRIAAIAAAARVPPAYLTRVFRQRAGCSPARWLRVRRIEVAKDLLRSRSRSIADIALELGFYDQSHFTNVFVREVGLAPSQFRHGSAGPVSDAAPE